MKFTFDEIAKATGATILQCLNTSGTFAVSTDSRTINADDVYLPLVGENFDGHNFIESALEKGARGYFTSDKNKVDLSAKFVLYVEDTLIAYLKLASFYREKVNPIVIAITGSSGKTTTKEMMYSVAKQAFRTHKSILNHNNEVGLCQTMLGMPQDTEVLVVEMGMRGLGEIELLAKYAKPDIAIVANTGTAHIGRLGSVENIAKAKCEVTKHLNPEGLFLAHDTALIRAANTFVGKTVYLGLNAADLVDLALNESSCDFVYKNQEYKINVEGAHNIQNSLFVINAALKLGMKSELIAAGLGEYRPIEKRWEVSSVSGFKVINDSYNSNPESVRAAICAFLATQKPPRTLVLGDMGELGKDEKNYHLEVGKYLKDNFYEFSLITVGKLAKYIARGMAGSTDKIAVSLPTNKDAAKYILENVPVGTTMLFKASRSMKFEEIIKELQK
jgi:UDP-N-acetylmuramoyl-tripeptide--D-alanyl-D-alanine ligase